jgi:polysaccharide export outer membrane protein
MPKFQPSVGESAWATNALPSGSRASNPRSGFARAKERGRRQTRTAVFALVSVVVPLLCGGCQAPPPLRPEQMVPPKQVNLAPGDVVRFSFTAAPELTGSQKIRADGKLSMPLIGEVDAAGKQLLELQRELEGLYKSQLNNSEVVVTLESGATQIYLSGMVKAPGKLTLERPLTVFEAIMEVGGFSDFADPAHVRVIHLKKGQHDADFIDLRPALKGRQTRAYYVSPGDVIYVPSKVFNF